MSTSAVFENLADLFIREEVNTCFALLGDANMNWAAAMSDRGCRFIYVRHEHCGVASAMAFSRSTGQIGVATVTCGPGLTQILTALPAAVRASIPLVIFAGEAPLSATWYNQAIDQAPFVRAAGAHYVAVHDTTTMSRQVRDAFLFARINRVPVVLGVPLDLQEKSLPRSFQPHQTIPSSLSLLPAAKPVPPAPEQLVIATRLIQDSEKIVVMGGLGAVEAGAGDGCEQLAEKTGGLLATTLPARGLFHSNPYCLGVAGGFSSATARKLLPQADLVIAVGSSLARHNSDNGKLFKAERVLHVDSNPSAVSQGREAAHHHLQSDARLGVEALLSSLEEESYNSSSPWRSPELADEIRDTPPDETHFDIEENLVDPRELVASLDDTLPLDWFMVNSSGHCSYFFAQMRKRPVENFLTIREFGAIGNGIAFAMGVAVAHPSKRVVLFDGDGSALMHIQELETIVRHKLNILLVIMNDGAYGSEIHKLRAEGLADEGAVFGRPDFAAIASGFGASGETVNSLDRLPAVLAGLTANDGLAVLDVHVSDKVVSPVIQRSHANH